MAKWLKGMAYLSAFDPDRKGKKIRHRTNVMIVIGLIINITVSACAICMIAMIVFFLNGLIKSNR